MRKFILAVSVATVLLIVVILVGHLVGYDLRIVHTGDAIGIESLDGEYRLVEMTDRTGQYLLYSIIQLRGSGTALYPRTLFVSDDFWYHSRYIIEYGWMDASNDFYIRSSDTGTHIYRFHDGTWQSEFGNE